MFENIRPYDDEKAREVLLEFSNNEMVDTISEFLYPGKDHDILKDALKKAVGVYDFQHRIMYPAVGQIIDLTTDGLSVGGVEYLKEADGKNFLILSNHRDIVLDPALLQYVLISNGLSTSEIAVGNNLVSVKYIGDLMRSNRMIEVIRNGSPRELYASSNEFSDYIRRRINARSLDVEGEAASDGGASIWLAHRQGRTKNGYDLTEQGLLKMLDMSGRGSFEENFSELNIIPLSISYEFEPCGVKKAVETWKKATYGFYRKAEMEDINSIVSGITEPKGRVHMNFCKPISADELAECASLEKNDRYRRLGEIIDERIVDGYRIWNSSKDAWLMLKGLRTYPPFEEYIESELSKVPEDCDREAVRSELLNIYAAPYLRKQ